MVNIQAVCQIRNAIKKVLPIDWPVSLFEERKKDFNDGRDSFQFRTEYEYLFHLINLLNNELDDILTLDMSFTQGFRKEQMENAIDQINMLLRIASLFN